MNCEKEISKILVLCTISTGLESVWAFLQSCSSRIVGIVGLSPTKGNPEKVSGFVDISDFAKSNDIKFGYSSEYTLNEDTDSLLFDQFEFDIIWVAGWQRLIPSWLIKKANGNVIGVHGSPDGIQGGRGRSPQNWALILGCKSFDLAIFQITDGIDNGNILLQRSFTYYPQDDISTSYKKVGLLVSEMIQELCNNPAILKSGKSQIGEAFYYPQRKPMDGYVDWGQSSEEIARACRALTKPYPGLRTKLDDQDIIIWKCQEFDSKVSSEIGQVSHVFLDSSFLVNTKNGRIIVIEWQIESGKNLIKKGVVLKFSPIKLIYEKIIKSHEEKHPGLRISPRILNLLA